MLGSVQIIPWKVGDRVRHYRDQEVIGTVAHSDGPPYYSVEIVWDDGDGHRDFQWSNKLIPASEDRSPEF